MIRLLRVYWQAKWVWECWYRYDMSDERFQRALIGLFELIPEQFKMKVHRDKYRKGPS